MGALFLLALGSQRFCCRKGEEKRKVRARDRIYNYIVLNLVVNST